mgnify:CR=1 FL=1
MKEFMPPPFSDLACFYCKHIGDEVSIIACDKYIGGKLRLTGHGINEIHKVICLVGSRKLGEIGLFW